MIEGAAITFIFDERNINMFESCKEISISIYTLTKLFLDRQQTEDHLPGRESAAGITCGVAKKP